MHCSLRWLCRKVTVNAERFYLSRYRAWIIFRFLGFFWAFTNPKMLKISSSSLVFLQNSFPLEVCFVYEGNYEHPTYSLHLNSTHNLLIWVKTSVLSEKKNKKTNCPKTRLRNIVESFLKYPLKFYKSPFLSSRHRFWKWLDRRNSRKYSMHVTLWFTRMHI